MNFTFVKFCTPKNLLGVFVLICLFSWKKFFWRTFNLPPGPGHKTLIIGASRYFKKLTKEFGGPYEAFQELSRRYNSSIISAKLGNELVVYITGYKAIREMYARTEFDGRPDNFFFRLRNMGYRLGMTFNDGSMWHHQKKFITKHLKVVGFGRQAMKSRIEIERNEIIELMRKNKEFNVGNNHLFTTSIINIIWTFCCGSQFERGDQRLTKLFNFMHDRSKAFDSNGGYLNQMPWLRFIAPEWTGYNLIKKLNAEFFSLLNGVVQEHMRNYSEDKANDDLIYAYIKEMKKGEDPDFSVEQIIIIILDFFIGGSTTVASTIETALMALILHPDVQKQCRKEIESVGDVSYENRHLLPYTCAMLLETQRFFPIFALLGIRRTLTDCNFFGFEIPQYTTVLAGTKSILNDKEFWGDPENFRPERYLDPEDETGINKTLRERTMTFGVGRRKCVGDQLAKEAIFSIVVGIIQSFELDKNEKALPSLVLIPGLTYTPKKFILSLKEI